MKENAGPLWGPLCFKIPILVLNLVIMARVQYGVVITEIKGKVGGSILQGGNVGFVLRNKGYTKGISSRQRYVSSKNVSLVASLWRTLSDSDRAQWVAAAANWPFTNRFGQTYTGSGYQVWMAYNLPLVAISGTPVPLPNTPSTPDDPGILAFTTCTPASMVVEIDNASTTDDYIFIYASAPVSTGRNGNNIPMAFMGCPIYDGVTSFDITSAYLAKYGTPPDDAKIFIRAEFRRFDYPYPSFQQFATGIVS